MRQQQYQQPANAGTAPIDSSIAGNTALLRRVACAKTSIEALDMLLQQHSQPFDGVEAADAELVLSLALEKSNVDLALAIYADMCASRRSAQRGRPGAAGPQWPAASLATTVALILGLCRQLRVVEALAVMQGMRTQGMPRNEEVSFGFVVPSPLPPNRPLAVVQPQEGAKVVADSESRYEFELFSGTVTSCSSEAQQPASNWALAAARAVGLWKAPPIAAVHTWVVRAPDGASRTFRAATATADVPAQVGERVTVVSAPERGRSKQRRLLLSTAAPGMRPGEPMSVVNHKTSAVQRLGRPLAAGATGGLPSWVLPAAVVLAGSDAASALLDPALPALIAAGAAAAAGSAVASSSLLLPRLKQLPTNAVKIEGMRQALLAQHAALSRKVEAALGEASEDARALARLWQLQVKMESVGGGAAAGAAAPAAAARGSVDSGDGTGSTALASAAGGGPNTYAARIGRVETARRGVEERLASRLELLDGYARVIDMIEIEVEMEIDVAAAELTGIGEQIERLTELEALQEEWRTQAEAQDEVRPRCWGLRTRPKLTRVGWTWAGGWLRRGSRYA
ncbi:hypothetical protein MNEG_2935 [Monoraphidium neglectum]|uniref:Uncharacterized protein n=1 Tax=Monoraphidium neglectum TaxID=145388 RepID=A0A0D2NJG5_9CHLO|nr:hypothetical protein MNEG_2935 [Monoraphidium neglectum]KIZ05021.1 hypothetical protein MNEG_2935 [Monoraphidium neglectum]|eukprot:XP_013904040.1 hypothetical protein MNEG_2935 [Monoraphidium neglectum]